MSPESSTAPPLLSPEPGAALWVRYRTAVSVAAHLVLFALSLLIAFGLAYNFRNADRWFVSQYLTLLVPSLIIKWAVFGLLRLYRGSWRYVGLRDVGAIVVASHFSTFLFVAAYYLFENIWKMRTGHMFIQPKPPDSVFLIDFAGTIALVSAARIAVRFYYEEFRAQQEVAQTRLLIVGAGDAGESLLRDILRMPEERYNVVGFLDDDPAKQHARIHGVEVLGTIDELPQICEKHDVQEVLIALPAATQREIRRIVSKVPAGTIRFRTVPALADLIEGRVHVSQIRDVQIADLLRREPVTLDTQAIERYIRGRRVAVSGAGGSIGSEMCRQIARFGPASLILIERAENSLFEIDAELRRRFPDLPIHPYVADICDRARIDAIFTETRPQAVFHAAAHKHVPMMELNVGEAIKNNVLGTRTLADLCVAHGVEKMVMISTDKAVNPTSVMGCSKRVAEMYVQELSHRSRTQFVTVRFGNVLGSSGSVVPIFQKQIAEGGPVTVTHPDMQRYFMTISEAAQLVLQAGAMGSGGEIFVLDMGEPVRIVDLACDLIRLSGLRPHEDIEIIFTGVRPGEKLVEELAITGEDISRTSHPKIGIWRCRREDWDALCAGIERLLARCDNGAPDVLKRMLKDLVPEYDPEYKVTPPPRTMQIPRSDEATAAAAPPATAAEPRPSPA